MQKGLIESLENKEPIMSSLEIAKVIGKPHSDTLKAIRNMEPSWEKIAQGKFSLGSYKDANNQSRPCFFLTKRETLYVATKFKDEDRAKLVIRWEELEKSNLSQQHKLPQTYSEALRELADKVEQNERLMLENKQQQEKIRLDAPKVNYFEAFMNAAHGSKSVGIREVVKQAHIKSEKKFITWMLDRRILFRQKRDNRLQPYAEFAKCFDTIDVHDNANDWSGKQLLMNPYGKLKIVKRYHEEQPVEFDSPRDMFANTSALAVQ